LCSKAAWAARSTKPVDFKKIKISLAFFSFFFWAVQKKNNRNTFCENEIIALFSSFSLLIQRKEAKEKTPYPRYFSTRAENQLQNSALSACWRKAESRSF